jgi:hypothetical protein
MRKLSDFLDQQLTWVQPHGLRREYVLRAKDKVVATLAFRNLFSSFATGESADGRWTFKRERVGSVTVRACGTDADLAVFKVDTWTFGGTLEFPDGRQIRTASNFWGSRYAFKTAAGEVLFRFEKRGLIPWLYLRLRGTVEIARAGAGTAELPWMLMLGWYLLVLRIEEANLTSG